MRFIQTFPIKLALAALNNLKTYLVCERLVRSYGTPFYYLIQNSWYIHIRNWWIHDKYISRIQFV